MKKIVKVLGISAMLAAAMAISASAATITNVKFACGAPEDDTITDGYTTPEFTADEAEGYELSSVTDLKEDSNFKNPHTFELVFNAESGYEFPDGNSVTVSGSGITEITRKKMEDDGDTLVVRCKAYVYYRLDAPGNLDHDDSAKKMTWDKGGASNFEYILTYTDQNGEDQVRKGTTTGSSLSTKNYEKELSEKQKEKEDNEKVDMELTGFAIRAISSSTNNPRVAPSAWATWGTDPSDEGDFKEYESWSDLGMGRASGSTSSSGSSSTGVITPSSSSAKNGWQGSGDNWYWYQNGTMMRDYWVLDGGNWYWIGSDGLMKSGWQWDGSGWYYMNQQHDGTFGRMMSGWITLNGNRYYLNTVHDGTFGKMFTGTHVIDGVTYNFNADGVCQ